ncbi:DUF3667 domain-containing protein [Flavobacterium longum]|uniref:DUF3667 domain-containing protein n=1 Tax=Flavobacterium longum TaxID=1299340 RepID=UPI0039E9C3E7
MNETCRNCQHEVVANFCGNCGQKKHKRIDGKYIKDEMQYVLIHTNKGLFYSIKKIMRAPGTTALEFIHGNRVNHYKPILLVFLLAGISAFITNAFIHPLEVQQKFNEMQNVKSTFADGFSASFMKYQAIFMLLSVPFAAIFSWISFKKWGLNYCEHVIANSYFYAATLIFSITVTLPIQYFLRESPMLFVMIPSVLSLFSMFGIGIWFFVQLYPDKPTGPIILRLILTFVLMFGTIMVLALGGTLLYLLLNPEVLETMKAAQPK